MTPHHTTQLSQLPGPAAHSFPLQRTPTPWPPMKIRAPHPFRLKDSSASSFRLAVSTASAHLPVFSLPSPANWQLNPTKMLAGVLHWPQCGAEGKPPMDICEINDHVWGSGYIAITQDFCSLQSDHSYARPGEGWNILARKLDGSWLP